jgi:hypothetical protein
MTRKISGDPKARALNIELRSLEDGEHLHRRASVGDYENIVLEHDVGNHAIGFEVLHAHLGPEPGQLPRPILEHIRPTIC